MRIQIFALSILSLSLLATTARADILDSFSVAMTVPVFDAAGADSRERHVATINAATREDEPGTVVRIVPAI